VVTGGATGIGLAIAQRLIEEGAFVYLFGRRQAKLDQAVAALGSQSAAVQGSVSSADDVDRLIDRIRAEGRAVDTLVANAANAELATLGTISSDQYQRIFEVNVKGVILCVQACLPLMGKGSSIILIGSVASVMGTPNHSLYSASKAAVRSFARCWAQDLRGSGIRVNVLSPGPMLTDLAVETFGEDDMRARGARTPLGRIGDPAEAASVVAFLASDDSSFMTGSEVFVDGGSGQV
jgi:NAD(P)-dependent dehydrogenase (short-subunit alcohol dehydrogenase family)